MKLRWAKKSRAKFGRSYGWRFAWLPKRLDNDTVVWLEFYRRRRIYTGL